MRKVEPPSGPVRGGGPRPGPKRKHLIVIGVFVRDGSCPNGRSCTVLPSEAETVSARSSAARCASSRAPIYARLVIARRLGRRLATTSPLRSRFIAHRLRLAVRLAARNPAPGVGFTRPAWSSVVSRRHGLSGLSRRRSRVRVPSLALLECPVAAGFSRGREHLFSRRVWALVPKGRGDEPGDRHPLGPPDWRLSHQPCANKTAAASDVATHASKDLLY